MGAVEHKLDFAISGIFLLNLMHKVEIVLWGDDVLNVLDVQVIVADRWEL